MTSFEDIFLRNLLNLYYFMIFQVTHLERKEFHKQMVDNAQRRGEALEKYIFSKSPRLAACAALFFFYEALCFF